MKPLLLRRYLYWLVSIARVHDKFVVLLGSCLTISPIGHDFWHTTPLPRFNVPSVRLSDGPNGVRGTKFFNGVKAACLPCGTGLAATWNIPLLHKAGELIGEECKAKGAHCWLGPTVCIQRSPLGGRGFESLSEDPWLTGKLAASYINGVQSRGVISTIKHWVANDQEHERVGVNVMVNDRAMREIHMLPFQIALRESRPGAVMACYNKVNGTHVSESKQLLDDILRDEWNWDGVIMSDWYVKIRFDGMSNSRMLQVRNLFNR